MMRRARLALAAMTAVALAIGAGTAAAQWGRASDGAPSVGPSGGRLRTVLDFDAIEAILSPMAVPADVAHIQAHSPVIGVELGGESRAYSIFLLTGHEVANDVLGGEPIAATW